MSFYLGVRYHHISVIRNVLVNQLVNFAFLAVYVVLKFV